MADGNIRPGKAVGVLDRLGQPEGVLAVCPPLGKCAHLRQAPDQESTGEHRLDGRSPKALPEGDAVQQLDILPGHFPLPAL